MRWRRDFFFFNDTATTEIYTLSLHDALPISFLLLITWVPAILLLAVEVVFAGNFAFLRANAYLFPAITDRKSTRLNSSHLVISYAVFCLKKKNQSRRRGSGGSLCVTELVCRP